MHMNEKEKTALVPELRFSEFKEEWESKLFDETFEFHQTNTLSREKMNNTRGKVSNVHYGDVLIKYGTILDDFTTVPFINEDVNLTRFEKRSYLQNGDIVIADTAEDSTAGKAVELQNVDRYVLAGLHTMLCRPKCLAAPRFLGYYINSPVYHNSIVPLITGTKVSSISKANIKGTLVVMPKLPEQRKIADCLSSLDELISAEDKKLESLKAHKRGLMHKLFPAEGETLPEWRFPEFRGSGEWEEKPLAQVGDIITGNTPSTADADNYGGNKMFVSPADISELKYVVETKTKLTEKGFSTTRKIPANSVLFVCIGSTIGKVAQNKCECATNQQINAIVPFKDYISDFIYYVLDLNSPKISELAGKQAVPIVNKSLFSSVMVSIPEYDEQQKIADCLSGIDDLIAAQIKRIDSLQLHKKGLLQGLFPSAKEVGE